MRAVVYHGARDVRVEDVPEPDGALLPDEVLLAPRWCGICGTDLHEYATPCVGSPIPTCAISMIPPRNVSAEHAT